MLLRRQKNTLLVSYRKENYIPTHDHSALFPCLISFSLLAMQTFLRYLKILYTQRGYITTLASRLSWPSDKCLLMQPVMRSWMVCSHFFYIKHQKITSFMVTKPFLMQQAYLRRPQQQPFQCVIVVFSGLLGKIEKMIENEDAEGNFNFKDKIIPYLYNKNSKKCPGS